jgi:REP element-mobilizing transposase RayT
MPSIDTVKTYRANSYYHIYNRGAHKSPIFFDSEDYFYFIKCLQKLAKLRPIFVRAFALLPNHYHLLLFQQNSYEIVYFSRSLGILYAAYLRQKYAHSGRVFQSVYKASLKRGIRQTEKCERYILHNPMEAGLKNWIYVGTNIFSIEEKPSQTPQRQIYTFPQADLRNL